VLVAVIVATLALHGAIELVGYEAYDTLDTVFVPTDGDDGWAIPEPSGLDDLGAAIDDNEDDVDATDPLDLPPPALYPASELLDPTPTPSPTPKPKPVTARWAADGRLNMLLIGSDAGPDRWMLRTDTMIVLSIDNKTGRAALFGVPRNLVGVPLPPESAGAFKYGRFPGLLNALYVYAMKHPDRFPGGDARGFRAVTGAVQELVGVRLDSVVVVNLAGFVKLVNALGGLWIRVEERVVDSFYPLEDGSGHIRIDIRAGCQRLSGRMALAYARSRHQDSDYGRMERQQAVLVALARQVDAIRIVPRVRSLLSIAKGNLWMTVKRADIGGLARLAERVDPLRVKRILFVPPAFASHLTTPEINRIRAVVHSALRTPGPAPREWYARPCP
jgi:LCP family protein required for cell wall assembly